LLLVREYYYINNNSTVPHTVLTLYGLLLLSTVYRDEQVGQWSAPNRVPSRKAAAERSPLRLRNWQQRTPPTRRPPVPHAWRLAMPTGEQQAQGNAPAPPVNFWGEHGGGVLRGARRGGRVFLLLRA
jgi:hypothetical protein